MTLPMPARASALCDRCGRMFPDTDARDDGRTFCEPCRDAMWRDERGLPERPTD